MSDRILITGGAGFIGSHLAVRLGREGYRVRVLDSLAEQVHSRSGWPPYLPESVEPPFSPITVSKGGLRNADIR